MANELVLDNFDKLSENENKVKYNKYNNSDVTEFRKDFFAICEKLLERAYAKNGHKAWRYAFVNNCLEFYGVKVQYGTIKDMENGEKNATSRMYVLLIFEIQRLYGTNFLEKLNNI